MVAISEAEYITRIVALEKQCAVLSAQVDRLERFKELVQRYLNKTVLKQRWPCPDCGRKNSTAPLNSLEYTQADGLRVTAGCWLCNTEELRTEMIDAVGDYRRAMAQLAKER